jgi:hypothetical protein
MIRYASKANPYSIAYPADWRHMSGHLSGNYRIFMFDEFYDPRKSHGFNVNVVVAQIPVPYAITTASYTRESIQSLQAKGLPARQVGTVTLAGRRVPLVAYADVRAHLQAFLAVSRHVWVFGLTTAIGDSSAWAGTYETMLRSIQLR